MYTHLSKYFCITGFKPTPDHTMIELLSGYYTDQSHSLFLPPIRISREEVLSMIQTGFVLFVENKKIKPTILRIITVENDKYLRFDGESIPKDDMGRL